jgi:hypothetical protein
LLDWTKIYVGEINPKFISIPATAFQILFFAENVCGNKIGCVLGGIAGAALQELNGRISKNG